MNKKYIRKNKRMNKGRKFTKARNYSFDNPRDQKKIEKKTYQEYLRNKQKNIENVDYKHLENVFTNEVHYRAMKELPLIEKRALYIAVFDASDLEKACAEMKMTKKEVIKIKTKAINRFKDNVEKQLAKHSKKNGGGSNGK